MTYQIFMPPMQLVYCQMNIQLKLIHVVTVHFPIIIIIIMVQCVRTGD
jgi:hypothetical protein